MGDDRADDHADDPDGEAERGSRLRALARRTWLVRRTPAGADARPPLATTTTAAERLAMVWPLTLDAWAMTGEPIFDLPRDQWPIRRVERRIAPPAAPA